MSWAGEGSRMLTGPVPLRGNQQHCAWCSGYGATPAPRDDPGKTYFNPIPCWRCDSTGIDPRPS